MAGKIYAVRKGRTTGLFQTWAECKAQVDGFAGAQYKSFKTREEAEQYLKPEEKKAVLPEQEVCVAYVDGSYNQSRKIFGYGIVLLMNGTEEELFGTGEDEEAASMRNVAGEILGAEKAVLAAQKRGARRIVICHDYMGISEWAEGRWKRNLKFTQSYKEFMDEERKRIEIVFRKVEAHSGDHYNDLADKLAKKGAGVL